MSDMTEFISILQNVLEELAKAEKIAQNITYDGEKHCIVYRVNHSRTDMLRCIELAYDIERYERERNNTVMSK